jgi:hypothetical protein
MISAPSMAAEGAETPLWLFCYTAVTFCVKAAGIPAFRLPGTGGGK